MGNSVAGGPGQDEVTRDRCADCSDELDPELDRGFAIGPEAVLCFRCAVARGGSWDESQERWTIEPEVGDLGEGG
jgi:hypothetical protein